MNLADGVAAPEGQRLHPDWLVGPALDEVVALFGDIDFEDDAAVDQRVADLQALAGGEDIDGAHRS